MKEQPYTYFVGSPLESVEVPSLFRQEGVRKAVEDPPTLRSPTVGWDLQTLNRVEIVDGKRLRVRSGERQVIELFDDGRMVGIAILGDFLGWPRTPEQFSERPEINTLALIEYLYNCCLTYHAVAQHFVPTPKRVSLRFGFRNFVLDNGNVVYLARSLPGRVGFPRHEGHEASATNKDFDPVEIDLGDDPAQFARRAGFALLKAVFNWFRYTDDEIPLADLNALEIDTDAFGREVQA